MANKKITVTDSAAEEPMVPDETQKVVVRVKRSAEPEEQVSVAEEMPVIDEPIEQPVAKKTIKIVPKIIDNSVSEAISTAPSAPPLPKKIANKISVTITEHESEAMPQVVVEAAREDDKDSVAQAIGAEPSIDFIPEEDTEKEPETTESAEDSVDTELTAIDDSQADDIETIDLSDSITESEETKESGVPKYKPPDGPMPFKRAEQSTLDVKTPLSGVSRASSSQTATLLTDEDEAIAKAFEVKPIHHKQRRLLRPWVLGLFVLILVILGLGAIPKTRNIILNIFGVHGMVTVTVVDSTLQTPVQGAQVSIGSSDATTNMLGVATLDKVKLGKDNVNVAKTAYATQTKQVMVSSGTTRLGSVELVAVGNHYTFDVIDTVSGKSIAQATATSGQASAVENGKGQIILVAEASPGAAVTITATGYQTTTISLPSSTTSATNVQLIPSGPELFVAEQAGTYNVYKADVTGQHKQLLLAGSGYETSQMSLVPDVAGDQAALVSTRDDQRNNDGDLLQTLTLIDTSSGAATTADHADQLKIIGWFGDRIVYVTTNTDTATTDPARYQLISYDYKTKQRLELDHANYFNDVLAADGFIYYASSNSDISGSSAFIKIAADGSGKQTLLNSEVLHIFRTDYNDLVLVTATSRYAYTLNGGQPVITTNTYDGTGRLYVDSPDGKNSVYVDTRDDTQVLVVYNKTTQQETVLTQPAGLAYPIRWLNNSTLIYRVTTGGISADYAIGINGGTGKKITDVVSTNGLELWNY
jgi:hypothetical protein